MKDIHAARVLLQKAKNDLLALKHMRDAEAFSEDIFGFHVQQAVEKTLKAWLALLGVIYPKTHDINLLLRLIEQAGQNIIQYEDFVEYNMYAVQFRYEEFAKCLILQNIALYTRFHCFSHKKLIGFESNKNSE